MQGDPLTFRLSARVSAMFADADGAAALLTQSCNPFPGGGAHINERVRAAVVKLSGGSAERLARYIEEANTDWRDVLLWAGFGEDARAHERWLSETA